MDEPPGWALRQRALLDRLADASQLFWDRYVATDGSLHWRAEFPGRDGADDGYESFLNWPLAYTLGGPRRLLSLAAQGWHGVTGQFTRYGQILDEYERGYDWFHQGEGNALLYQLALADPAGWRERVARFADLYADPARGNYDPATRTITAGHTGSGGPRLAPYRFSYPFTDDLALYEWTARHEPYGLPYRDLPGIARFEDLKDPANARRMGEAMNRRMLPGDTAVNLTATGLVTLAHLVTGEPRYRRWVLDYVEAWIDRARANGGLPPDNVGRSGRVGENLDGRWYGGLYGWSWPHGLGPIASAAVVAATSAYLLTRDDGYLDLPRTLLDRVLERAVTTDDRLLVPNRYDDRGWFDHQPMEPRFAVALWHLSGSREDWARVERLRRGDPDDWSAVPGERGRFGDANTRPWVRYLAGANPGYPSRALGEAHAQLAWRCAQIRADREPAGSLDLHHWQLVNPIGTEALVQLTLGGPAPIYNGGLPHARLRYADADRGRPGLPPDVAALVDHLDARSVSVRLVNLHPTEARRIVIQGGAFGEYRFTTATLPSHAGDGYPGPVGSPRRPRPPEARRQVAVDDRRLSVALPPGHTAHLELATVPCPPETA
ncbi:hypothetical protein [Rugosimonospora acidiphila]